MIVNSQNIEFGYELISAIPYAYYLHTKGELTETISAKGSEAFYYFSPKHTINPNPRSWYNTPKAKNIPNIDIHKPYLLKDKFNPPPYKEYFANDEFKFEKETVVICNRINREWGKEPINFFDLPTLEKLFKLLSKKYQIIYINIKGKPELYDNAPPIDIKDYELLKEYPEVINIHDLHEKHNDISFNELQLKIFANCEKYITLNGGHSILASYFGGENIIMSKYGEPQAKELNDNINSFYRWYDQFGGQRVLHVENETNLIKKIKSLWIKKEPIANIIVRTSNRPNYFAKCIESIEKQDYENINIIVTYENADDLKYITPYKCYAYKVNPNKKIPKLPKGKSYRIEFHANEYIDDAVKKIKTGFIIAIDDDDEFTFKNSISQIAINFKKDSLIFWQVNIGEQIVPNIDNFVNKKIIMGDISGIGIAHSAGYSTSYEYWKRGDYRTAIKLSKEIKNQVWLRKKLTKTQSKNNNAGNKKDITGTYKSKIKFPNKNIFNFLNEKHKKREYKTDKKEFKFGKTYKFICMPTENVGVYKWNGIIEKMLQNGQLKEI